MTDPILAGLGVSRETEARLREFEALVRKWSRKINLVAAADLPDLWTRHILDSAQLAQYAPGTGGTWLDIGSGGGFPGLVLAILLQETRPDLTLVLVESDGRKSAFLLHAAQTLGVAPRIITDRIESLTPQGAAVVTARALAPLSALLAHAQRHLAPEARAIFPKGRNWAQELAEARREWQFSLTTHPSLTDPEARILVVGGLSRA